MLAKPLIQRRFSPHWLAVSIAAGFILVWVAAMGLAIHHAALPPEASGRMFAVFPPGLSNEAMVRKIAAAGGQPIRQTWASSVWVVSGDDPGLAGNLKHQGAMSAYGELPIGMQLAGCFAWADTRVSQVFSLTP